MISTPYFFFAIYPVRTIPPVRGDSTHSSSTSQKKKKHAQTRCVCDNYRVVVRGTQVLIERHFASLQTSRKLKSRTHTYYTAQKIQINIELNIIWQLDPISLSENDLCKYTLRATRPMNARQIIRCDCFLTGLLLSDSSDRSYCVCAVYLLLCIE